MKYIVNVGRHVQDELDPETGKTKEVHYGQGEMFETDVDMLSYNGAGMTPKFVLFGQSQVGPDFAKYAMMDDEQLREECENREVDTAGCKSRQDVINLLIKA